MAGFAAGFGIFLVFLNILNSAVLAGQTTRVVIGQDAQLVCETKAEEIRWSWNGKNITKGSKRITWLVRQVDETRADGPVFQQVLTVAKVEAKDAGNYTCLDADESERDVFSLEPVIEPRVLKSSPSAVRVGLDKTATLFCYLELYPLPSAEDLLHEQLYFRRDEDQDASSLRNATRITVLNQSHVNMSLTVPHATKRDNGTYLCLVNNPKLQLDLMQEVTLLVLDVPQVHIDLVRAVGMDKIFLNWTVNDGNANVTHYRFQYLAEGEPTFTYYNSKIPGNATSLVLHGFRANTKYQLKMQAINSVGDSRPYQHPDFVRTLERDPDFIPVVDVKGSTHTTVTIGWQPPPPEVLDYVHYYELVVERSGDEPQHVEEAIHPQNSRNLPYMFDNLQPATEYSFRVRACSELTKFCGNWSLAVNGTTMDGAPSRPLNLRVFCRQTNVSSRSSVEIHWDVPERPNGVITVYQTVLQGVASYRLSTDGVVLTRNETFGPKSKYEEKMRRTVYDAVPPNTNYTVRVTGITRNKQRPGEAAEASCRMPPTVPDQPLGKFLWGRVRSGDHSTKERPWMINLSMPRISERNGPICCYLVYVVKMPRDVAMQDLPHPANMEVFTYHQVHHPNNTRGGAYIAEVVDGGAFQSKLFLGKGRRHVAGDQQQLGSAIHDMQTFRRCLLLKNGRYHWWERQRIVRPAMPPPPPLVVQPPGVVVMGDGGGPSVAEESDEEEGIISATLPTVTVTGGEEETTVKATTTEPTKVSRRRRRRQHLEQPADPQSTMPSYEVFDGPMDVDAYYTGYVEVIVKSGSGDSIMTVFSDYFDEITLGESEDSGSSSSSLDVMYILDIVVQILTGMIVLLVVLLLGLCVIRRYHLKKIARMNEMGDESISLRDSLRVLCGGGRPQGNQHRHLIGATTTSKPPDVAPIARADMQQAFLSRHKDSDYGFQQEFELLPDRFTDRTTKHSEAKENGGKNRYPDIKAYDQTRVKLNGAAGGVPGTDYINANFVIGYKERKKFICAQGPMEGTLQDFWRMVWEQHLEIMVMLTNLEEYNKTKCAKYWPEKLNDQQTFGEITVRFVGEERMADYVVRELKVTRRTATTHSTENGVNANGSTGGGGGGGDQMANSTSEASATSEGRIITQYHYLMWKDFMAPEHPQGITRFIRQINSVYSVQRGPILVHCSAGVGRTGTLVALDSLLQQLEEENQVAIFNTVCDLRHQRNFLVQSLKQYIFLYRALTEAAVFGSTELAVKDLGSAVEQLKQKGEGETALCALEQQFQKLCNAIDDQMGPKKTTAQGASAENSAKNRDAAILPYDRNRVILSPLSTREYSTYINASFIEGSDHAETFIVTQDPIADGTVGDLWRMVSEQSISTLVMMSEIGEGARKCPRYWADDEVQYDHILVKYIQSESCPYYTRREFKVTNCKIDDTIQVMQFQYNGWPTVEGEVPEVCRGIIELVDQAMKQQQIHANMERPVAVHCTTGTDRSSIFVAMCFLVQQLRTEKKVDICSVVRKLRSQRMGMMETYAQYEFLHRAIVQYADLHKLSAENLVVCD